jgi:ankyrin repeat protein
MGFSLIFIASREGSGATPGKRTVSAAAKDREIHRLLTESPLDWARLLLSQGANIEARNLHQETPLITGAGQGNVSLVELLLQNHADIHAADAEGNTGLACGQL